MTERPLLLFPRPENADCDTRRMRPPPVHRPSGTRQGERLSPIFSQLQETFDSRNAEILQDTAGIDPEQVLVIEIIGSIENFANAVQRIEGLEWMGEIEAEELIPDDDFYREDNREKKLTGRLYLVLTNQRALGEMLSLWRRYQENPDMTFERGLTKFRDVFLHLKDIRRWSVEDRLEDSGLLDIWREDLLETPERAVRFEAELWFRGSNAKRAENADGISRLVGELEGQVVSQCVINEIAYHSIMLEIPANAAQQIIDHPDVDLMRCDSVMFFRPVGQMAVGRGECEGEPSEFDGETGALPTGDPLIAVLDGLPLENHDLP
jgi:hypothetical protein